jgi:drug/metabolite transporter (DMT)-like permease
MARVPRSVYLFLAVGLIAASQSGNLVRLAANAPPVTIAAWRLLLASILFVPLAGPQFTCLKKLRPKEWMLLLASGAALSAHLCLWIAAVQKTNVVSAAIFFSINPLFTSVAAFFIFRERLTARLFLSIGLGLLGTVAIGWSDFGSDQNHFEGDALALLCSLFFTLYFLIGKKLRRTLPTQIYVCCLYAMAGIISMAIAVTTGEAVVSFDATTWVAFALLALIPTMIGHTSLNHALRYLDTSRVSAATLCEPPLAGFVAYWAWGETIGGATTVGYLLISASVLVLLMDRLDNPKEERPRCGAEGAPSEEPPAKSPSAPSAASR